MEINAHHHDGRGGVQPSGVRALLLGLGSLWLAALLLMLLLVAMACATIFESAHGAEQTLASFYCSWWFEGLLGLLAVNVLAAAVVRYPFSRRQIGFLLAHAGILVVFGGALVSQFFGVDGRVGIAEGQTVEHFNVDGDFLTLTSQQGHTRISKDFGVSGIGGFEVVERPRTPALIAEGLRVEVRRYLPDGRWTLQVHNDNPSPNMALHVSLSESGKDDPEWVFAGRTAKLGAKLASFRVVSDGEALNRILEGGSADKPLAAGVIKAEYGGSTFKIPLKDCRERAVALWETGYAVRLIRYLPHAVVGEGKKITNLSDRPVNPAIEVEVTWPGGSETQLLFARFPDFKASHDEKSSDGPKLTFEGAIGDKPEAPVDIYGDPTGRLCVRFAWPGAHPVTRELTIGVPVESPWAGRKLTVLRRLDHARADWVVTAVDPVRPKREPMILVNWVAGEETGELWLQKYRPEPLHVGGAGYDLVYENKRVPLGFALTLDRFHLGYYPGGRSPRSFESYLSMTNGGTGETQSQLVSMNNPGKYAGYSLYQSSYQMDRGRTISFLGVSRDPGLPIVFAGYITMMVGMVVVMVTRIKEKRRRSPSSSECSSAPDVTGELATRAVKPVAESICHS